MKKLAGNCRRSQETLQARDAILSRGAGTRPATGQNQLVSPSRLVLIKDHRALVCRPVPATSVEISESDPSRRPGRSSLEKEDLFLPARERLCDNPDAPVRARQDSCYRE